MRYSPRPSQGSNQGLGKGGSENRLDCDSPGAEVLPLCQTKDDRMFKIAVKEC